MDAFLAVALLSIGIRSIPSTPTHQGHKSAVASEVFCRCRREGTLMACRHIRHLAVKCGIPRLFARYTWILYHFHAPNHTIAFGIFEPSKRRISAPRPSMSRGTTTAHAADGKNGARTAFFSGRRASRGEYREEPNRLDQGETFRREFSACATSYGSYF